MWQSNWFLINFKHIWAVAKKELFLDLRYILPFIAKNLVNPLKIAGWFLVVYYGFFSFSPGVAFGSFTKENYVANLLIGITFYIFFNIAMTDFPTRMWSEKWWQTIQGFLIAPINSLKLILGITLAEFIKVFLSFLIITGIIELLHPISLVKFMLVFLIVLITFIYMMALGLIRATYVLINENVAIIIEYLYLIIGFFSCFYYPIESFPTVFRAIIYYNPIYQSVNLTREIWLGFPLQTFSIVYGLVFAVILIILGTTIFNRATKKYEIEGY